MPYYAVRVGRTPGIYNNWLDCESNIKDLEKPVYKKFDTEEEAKIFLKSSNISLTNIFPPNTFPPNFSLRDKKKPLENILESQKKIKEEKDNLVRELINKSINNQVIDDEFDFENAMNINIYVYGIGVNDGQDKYYGSIGLYYGEDDFRNESKKISFDKDNKDIKVNNKNYKNRAELKSALVGLSKVIDRVIKTGKCVIIHTDSDYIIKCFTQDTLYKYEEKQIQNYDYIKKGFEIISKYPQIKFHYVKNLNSLKIKGSPGLNNAKKLALEAIIDLVENITFKFGKFKDKSFVEIYSQDSEYFDWCLLNCQSQINEIKVFLDSKNY